MQENKALQVSKQAEPGGRAPAPDELGIVQQFINSIDIEADTEEFDSPAALSTWLWAHGLTGSRRRLTRSDLDRARRFRELLRAMVLANNGVPTDPAMLREVNREFAALPFVGRWDTAKTLHVEAQGTGLDEALGWIAAIVSVEMVRGRWSRLKACAREACHWAFYDHSRNRSGTWCAMAICGSRVKVNAYYRRRHHRTGGRRPPRPDQP